MSTKREILAAKVENKVTNTTEERRAAIVDAVMNSSDVVVEEFTKTLGKRGIISSYNMIVDGKNDEEILAELRGENKHKAKLSATSKELKARNKLLAEENKKLKAKLALYEETEVFFKLVWSLDNGLKQAKRLQKENANIFSSLAPRIRKHLATLKINVIDAEKYMPSDLRIAIKKAYRLEAKKLHPDISGDADMFIEVNTAYKKLMEVFK